MELLGGYRRELAFYRHIAPEAPISTPGCTRRGSTVTPSCWCWRICASWDNADHLAGLSIGRTTAVHRRAGRSARLVAAEPRIPLVCRTFRVSTTRSDPRSVPAGLHPGLAALPGEDGSAGAARVARFADGFAELASQALDALPQRTMLLHGDIRADNLFFRGDELKIVDFQLAVRGCGAADIAYLVSQGLPTSVRRKGQDDALVRGVRGRAREAAGSPTTSSMRHGGTTASPSRCCCSCRWWRC